MCGDDKYHGCGRRLAGRLSLAPTTSFASFAAIVPTSTSAISTAYTRVNCSLIHCRAYRDNHLHSVRGHGRLLVDS